MKEEKSNVVEMFKGESPKKGAMDDDQKRKFHEEISSVLNGICAENNSNTPDFILARYLLNCLESFNEATIKRDGWYNVNLEPTNSYFIEKKEKGD